MDDPYPREEEEERWSQLLHGMF